MISFGSDLFVFPLATDLDHLELALLPFPVNFQLLGPITDRTGSELLFRQAYVGDFVRALIDFDSHHKLVFGHHVNKYVARAHS